MKSFGNALHLKHERHVPRIDFKQLLSMFILFLHNLF